MTKRRADLGASVTARLLNRARSSGEDFQTLLTLFCLERFLYRVGSTPLHDRFVLKGALLLRVWSDQPYRATRDLDLLRRGDSSLDSIRRDVEAISAAPVEPDGVIFDPSGIRVDAIRAEDEYAGVRVGLPVRCGTAELVLQIDMGVGDSVARTFQRRNTPIPSEPPIGLTAEYWQNPSRPAQVRAFARRSGLEVPDLPSSEFAELLAAFLLPVLEDLGQNSRRDATWEPGASAWSYHNSGPTPGKTP